LDGREDVRVAALVGVLLLRLRTTRSKWVCRDT
jgi:hypothetical protein